MTDTTNISALRDQWSMLHERKDLDVFICTVLTALEAESQRADDAERAKENSTYEWSEAQSNYDSARRKIRSAEAEIAALKAKLANPVVLTGGSIKPDGKIWYSDTNIIKILKDYGVEVKP